MLFSIVLCTTLLTNNPLVLNAHHQAVGKSDAEKEKAEARFKDVSEAYKVLSDPTKKQVSTYIYVTVCFH